MLGLFERLVRAIREGDDAQVEQAVLSLSRRNRLLAPLALVVGAFAVLFQGIKLLVTNWRLTLIQVLPAMWIWFAMINLKAHVFRGKQFNIVRGPVLVPLLLAVMAMTAAAFYLNAVFGFAIASSGKPEIKPAYAEARAHIRTIIAWGSVIGLALGFSGLVVTRWGLGWFTISFGIVVGIMMFAYVALPSRLLGLQPEMSRSRQADHLRRRGRGRGTRLLAAILAGPSGDHHARLCCSSDPRDHPAGSRWCCRPGPPTAIKAVKMSRRSSRATPPPIPNRRRPQTRWRSPASRPDAGASPRRSARRRRYPRPGTSLPRQESLSQPGERLYPWQGRAPEGRRGHAADE